MASSDCSTFALVCDNPCGLEASQLEALGVSVIPGALTSDVDRVGEFYRSVLESGVQKILSLHVSEDFSDSLPTARKACENNPDIAEAIYLVDSGNMPAAMGIMIERLSVALLLRQFATTRKSCLKLWLLCLLLRNGLRYTRVKTSDQGSRLGINLSAYIVIFQTICICTAWLAEGAQKLPGHPILWI